MDLNRLENKEDKTFEDEDDETGCREVEFSAAKRVDDGEEEEYWDEESDDEWCREMDLKKKKINMAAVVSHPSSNLICAEGPCQRDGRTS